jgi:hypothetical protein
MVSIVGTIPDLDAKDGKNAGRSTGKSPSIYLLKSQ